MAYKHYSKNSEIHDLKLFMGAEETYSLFNRQVVHGPL